MVSTYYSGSSQPGKRTEYLFDRLDPVVEYSMWNGQRTNMYRDSNQSLLQFQDFKSETDPDGTLYWYHKDGEGNIAATTKHKAQSDHTYRYDEYGSILPDNGSGDSSIGMPGSGSQGASGWIAPHNQYTLTQKQFDANTNLYYFGARHYDPEVGMWLTQDIYRGELSDPQSLHRYMYNNASPVNYRDFYGYYAILPQMDYEKMMEEIILEKEGQEGLDKYRADKEARKQNVQNFLNTTWNKVPTPAQNVITWPKTKWNEYQDWSEQKDREAYEKHGKELFSTYEEYKQFNDEMMSLAISVSLPAPTAARPMTRVSPMKGWKVGQPINNRTSTGKIPTWTTVRQRVWKNEAFCPKEPYDPRNISRMSKGLAPQRINPLTGRLESKELHHSPAQRDGGLFDVEPLWPADHANVDPFRHLKE